MNENISKTIQLSEVTRSIGKKNILHGISCAFDSKQHTVLTGPSGAGKTTLLRLIAGLDTPTSGMIRMGDEVVSSAGIINVPSNSRGVALVFQDLGLWPNLTAIQNVMLAVPEKIGSRQERLEAARETLKSCEVASLESRITFTLSGGQAQRVALARAIAAKPACLLLDEPFANLDLPLKESLFALISSLIERKENLAVVTVSHSPQDAISLNADRLLVMESGEITEDVSFDQFKEQDPNSATLKSWKRSLEIYIPA